jgi:hypothetical protein|uniref:Uncharacterized protein n=1 Tax=viral metagenome TaxID=1070528 RepID=A0A6C0I4W8_9ZZZZ
MIIQNNKIILYIYVKIDFYLLIKIKIYNIKQLKMLQYIYNFSIYILVISILYNMTSNINYIHYIKNINSIPSFFYVEEYFDKYQLYLNDMRKDIILVTHRPYKINIDNAVMYN